LKGLYGVAVLPLIRLTVVHSVVVGTCGATAPSHAELARGKIAALRARACTGQLPSPPSRECHGAHSRPAASKGLLLVLHHRNLRGQLEIDNRLKAAVKLKEGRDRLARDYLAEYRKILDAQLRYLFIDRQ